MVKCGKVPVDVRAHDGRAQTAFCRFLESVKGSYSTAKQALLEHFERPGKKDVYAAEFQCRKKDRAESGGRFC